ncbi:hypothetical protein [Frondihabitans sp. PAMC 28766]|uniref:hypothetical protein n=1 Tax=Frondihabitans sp. PAMC 28766 TaxID=1795630 RepID=UPI0012FFA6AB|nr:hypothetical protein [Frondihabitans sp. PAMC 28766]
MATPTNADDIRHDIRDALARLQLLEGQGRVVMTKDRLNTDWPEPTAALTAAIDALDLPMSATTWMETLPHIDGGYPPLDVD